VWLGLDRRTKRLAGRLNPGDIAIIDHVDLDRVAAESLVEAKVSAVVNAQPSISGRYPNLGPDLLVSNGIALLDNVGDEVFAAVKEGTRVRLSGDTLYVGTEPVAKGTAQDVDSVADLMQEAKGGLSTQLEAFAANTMEYMKRERALLLDGVGVPEVRHELRASARAGRGPWQRLQGRSRRPEELHSRVPASPGRGRWGRRRAVRGRSQDRM
jgi:uncharacterized membrane-anchored protein